MQKNQCLGGGHLQMCKTCGKKCFKERYLFNSLMQSKSKRERLKKNTKISMSYVFVVFG
jgi:hypothetical protein